LPRFPPRPDGSAHRRPWKDGPMEILIVVLIVAVLIGLPAWFRNRRTGD
jgi:hypothetical protein